MPPKKTGIKALVGRPIVMQHRFEQHPEGPYIFLGIDSGFFGIFNPEKDREFWFNCNVIESFTEVKSVNQQ